MNFNNKVLFTFNLFGQEIWFTETLRSTYVVMAILTVFAIVVRAKINRFTDSPKGFQNVVEFIVETFDSFFLRGYSKKYSYYGNWFFAVFLFMLLCNLSGLLNLRPPTADLATTFAFASSTIFIFHFTGIKTKGIKEYLKSYLAPVPFFLPLNVLGELSRPVSLSFRPFGNLLGGTIIMGLIYNFIPVFLKVGVPAVLHMYFDVFSGAIQALVFTMLSLTFVKDQIADMED